MDQDQIKFLLQFIAIGTKVLSARVALFMTLLLTFALFAWAMYLPGEWRLATAVAFALLVFLPVIRMDAKHAEDRKSITQGE